MKQVQSKLWVKITALLLLSICSVVLLFSALGIAYLADQGGYDQSRGFVKDHIASNAFFSDMTPRVTIRRICKSSRATATQVWRILSRGSRSRKQQLLLHRAG